MREFQAGWLAFLRLAKLGLENVKRNAALAAGSGAT
jgi:hypothetical protein